jgi:anhydro-N-acetylmuramic acid kinase
MSRLSGEGIDAVLIETDGADAKRTIADYHLPFTPALQALLVEAKDAAQDGDKAQARPVIVEAEHVLMQLFVEAVRQLVNKSGYERPAIAVIGFLGHVLHGRSSLRSSWALGSGALLADGTDLPVMAGFDLAEGSDLSVIDVALAGAQRVLMLPCTVPGLALTAEDADNLGATLFQPNARLG